MNKDTIIISYLRISSQRMKIIVQLPTRAPLCCDCTRLRKKVLGIYFPIVLANHGHTYYTTLHHTTEKFKYIYFAVLYFVSPESLSEFEICLLA